MFIYAMIAIGLSFLIFLLSGGNLITWFIDIIVVTIILFIGASQITVGKGVNPWRPRIAVIIFIILFLGWTIQTRSFVSFIGVTVMILLASSLAELAARNRKTAALYIGVIVITGAFLIPIFTAWQSVVQSKAAELGVPASSMDIGTRASAGWNASITYFKDMWLAIAEPEKWYEEHFVERGKREQGATNLAIEIEKVELSPSESYTSIIKQPAGKSVDEEVSIIYSIRNKGDKTSSWVRFGAILDDIAYSKGAALADYDATGKRVVYGKRYVKPLGTTLYPNQPARQYMTLLTPYCKGTYELKTFIEYEYNVTGWNNIEFIDYNYYLDMLKRGKITPEDKLSTSSAGPFKVTLKTDKYQPIPVKDGVANFRLFVTVLNERDGHAFIKAIFLHLPKGEFELGESCDWKFYKTDPLDKYDIYVIKAPVDLTTKEGQQIAKEESTDRCINPNDKKEFSCEVLFKGNVLGPIEKPIKVEIVYIFRYEKSLSFTVSPTLESMSCDEVTEDIIPKERRNATLEKVLNKSCVFYKALNKKNKHYLCSVEADADRIADVLYQVAEYCLSQNYGGEDTVCATIKLDPIGTNCKQKIEIKSENLNAIEEGNKDGGEKKDEFYLTSIYLDGGKLELDSAHMYDIQFEYKKGVCSIGGDVKISKIKEEEEHYECNLDNGMPCNDSSQCSEGICNSAFKYMLSRPKVEGFSFSYTTFLKNTENFIYNILHEHEIEGEDLNVVIKSLKGAEEDYPRYYLWSNLEKSKDIPEDVRTLIQNLKPFFKYLNDYPGADSNIGGKVFPSEKVCQPSHCTYDNDPENPKPFNKEAGCQCAAPYFKYDFKNVEEDSRDGRALKHFYNNEKGYYCLPFCEPNKPAERPCFCVSREIYDEKNAENYENIYDAMKDSREIIPDPAKMTDNCESEEDYEKVRYICCIDNNGNGIVVVQTCDKKPKKYENGTIMKDENGNTIYEYYWRSDYGDFGDNFEALCNAAISSE